VVCVMMTDEDTSIWACLSVIVMSSIIHIKCLPSCGCHTVYESKPHFHTLSNLSKILFVIEYSILFAGCE